LHARPAAHSRECNAEVGCGAAIAGKIFDQFPIFAPLPQAVSYQAQYVTPQQAPMRVGYCGGSFQDGRGHETLQTFVCSDLCLDVVPEPPDYWIMRRLLSTARLENACRVYRTADPESTRFFRAPFLD
jgi:hypothetical protein